VLFEGNAKINGVSWCAHSIDMAESGEPGGNVKSVQIGVSHGSSAGGILAAGGKKTAAVSRWVCQE
jgi:hypothetical protein